MMRKAAVLGLLLAPALRIPHMIRCKGDSDTEKASKDLDKLFEEPTPHRTSAELETYLQQGNKVSGYASNAHDFRVGSRPPLQHSTAR